jgi:hypothetical protein
LRAERTSSGWGANLGLMMSQAELNVFLLGIVETGEIGMAL